MSKLKPCPFCGGRGKVMHEAFGYRVICAECGASCAYSSAIKYRKNKALAREKAKAFWNTRVVSIHE